MFESQIAALNSAQRIDHVVQSDKIRFVPMSFGDNEPTLGVAVDDSVMSVEEGRGVASLLRQWSIPAGHFGRLNVDLQCSVLDFMAKKEPRNLMLRAIKTPRDESGSVLRGVVSAGYGRLDNSELLDAISGSQALEDFQVRPIVHRDEMVIQAILPRTFDVSEKQVGDIIQSGISISNNELGYGAAEVSISTLRILCKNGLMAPGAGFRARTIHRGSSMVEAFLNKMRDIVAEAGVMGEALARRFKAAHGVTINSLSEDGERIERRIISTLRSMQLWGKPLQEEINTALAEGREERSLFGIVNAINSEATLAGLSVSDRIARQTASGRVLSLVD